MILRAILFATTLLFGVSAHAQDPWPESGGGASGLCLDNVACDTDGDGSPDYIRVSDYDGDGTLEIFDDVNAAVESLTDTGNKHIYVTSGEYGPPLLSTCDTAGEDCFDQIEANPDRGTGGGGGLIMLTDNTLLECAGSQITRFQGWDYAAAPGPPTDPVISYALIANTATTGNNNIEVRNCGLEGGGAATYTTSAAALGVGSYSPVKRGIQFYNVTNFKISGNVCRWTHHACYYLESSSDGFVEGNEAIEDGGFRDVNLGFQASFYSFVCDSVATATSCQDDDSISQDIFFVRNVVRDGGGVAFNLRNDNAPTEQSIGITLLSNSVYGALGCISVRGQDFTLIRDHFCQGGQTFAMSSSDGTNAYREGGNGYANKNINIDGLTIVNQPSTATQNAIQIGNWNEDIAFRNIFIANTDQACINWDLPSRNMILENVRLSNCGQDGIRIRSTGGRAASSTSEKLRINNLSIDGTDMENGFAVSTRYAGIHIEPAADFFELTNATIRGFSDRGIRFTSGGRQMVLKNVSLSCQVGKFIGFFTETGTNAADDQTCAAGNNFATLITTNASSAADCTFTSGTGAFRSLCVCSSGTWAVVAIGTNVIDQNAIDIAGAVDDSEFSNIVGENCIDEYTIGSSAAITDTKFIGIRAQMDNNYYEGNAGADPQHGALEIAAGSSNVLVDGRTIQCVNTDGTVDDCMAGAEDDLAPGSVWVDNTCDAPCTNGALCIDDDGPTGNHQVCEGGAWNPLDYMGSGASPAATCVVGETFLDTDETVDTNCTTTADNSLCLCTAANTWTALENN